MLGYLRLVLAQALRRFECWRKGHDWVQVDCEHPFRNLNVPCWVCTRCGEERIYPQRPTP